MPAGAGQLADLRLREPDLVERAAHAVLARGLAARPIVAAIVGVVAVEHHVDRSRSGDRRQCRVELVLAVVAAIDGVGAVLGPSSSAVETTSWCSANDCATWRASDR
jgi:sugar (pentulose or hexulose) kinase